MPRKTSLDLSLSSLKKSSMPHMENGLCLLSKPPVLILAPPNAEALAFPQLPKREKFRLVRTLSSPSTFSPPSPFSPIPHKGHFLKPQPLPIPKIFRTSKTKQEAGVIRKKEVVTPNLHSQGSLGGFGRLNSNLLYDPRPGTRIPYSSSPLLSSPSLCPVQHGTGSHPPILSSQTPVQEYYKGDSYPPSGPSFLFKTFPSQKKGQLIPSGSRSLSSQQVSGCSSLQNGVDPVHSPGDSRTSLGMCHGSGRCILPYSNRMVFPQIPSFFPRQQNLCLSIPSLWSGYSSLGFQQDYQPNKKPPPSSLNKISLLPGRFPFSGNIPRRSEVSPSICHKPFQNSGSEYKLQEVKPHSISEGGISGSSLPPRHPKTFPTSVKSTTNFVPLPSVPPAPFLLSTSSGESNRSSELGFQLRSIGSSPSETPGEVDEQEFFPSNKGSSSSPRPGIKVLPSSLARPFLPRALNSNVSTSPVHSVDDRLLQGGVVRSHIPSPCRERVAPGVCFPSLQHSRTESHSPLPPSLRSIAQEQLRDDHVGQHHSSLLHPPTRFLPVRSPHGADSVYSNLQLPEQHHADPKTYQRRVECLSRPGISPLPSPKRVVPGYSLLQVASSSGKKSWDSHASGRPVCHPLQLSARELCFSSPRPSGSGSQRPVPGLEQLGLDIPVPSSQSPQQATPLPLEVQRQRNSGRSLPCQIRLVSDINLQVSTSIPSSSQSLVVADYTTRKSVPSLSTGFKSSRVDTVTNGLKAIGFSKDAIDIALLSHRESTTRQYQSVWNYFLEFLNKESISSSDIVAGTVPSFLTVHAKTLGRQYRTLSGYRSALRHPIFLATGVDIINFPSDFFQRGLFAFNPPLKAKEMPKWSLDDLLNYLKCPLFEPLESAPFSKLLLKTLCLLIIATGRRIGDIANLSRFSFPHSSYDSLCLRWVRSYNPKFRTPKWSPSVPSIGYLRHPSGGVLCPVRAYTIYLNRISPWIARLPRSTRHPFLWISNTSASRIPKAQLSRLLISLVKDARRYHGKTGNVPIGPHQFRKFGASFSVLLNHERGKVLDVMGFTPSSHIFNKNYVGQVSPLKTPCVLPGGSSSPSSDLPSSD